MTTTSELGPVGISLDVDPAGAHLDAAAEIERLGYSTLWIPGGQLDRLDRITELVRATRRVTVVPGIIPVDVHPADAVARWHAELSAEAPGRVLVVRGITRVAAPRAAGGPGWHGELPAGAPGGVLVGLGGPQQQPRPLRALGHSLDLLAAADPPVPASRRILAALGPRKL